MADRHNSAGLQAALSDDPRPGAEARLDSADEAAVVYDGVWCTTGGVREVDGPPGDLGGDQARHREEDRARVH